MNMLIMKLKRKWNYEIQKKDTNAFFIVDYLKFYIFLTNS